MTPTSPVLMAEKGGVASIIGVASAGFRLSLLLNAVACQIASSGIEIHSISKGVSLFALTLKQVGRSLQAVDSVHSRKSIEAAREITAQSQTVFDEIEDMLDRLKGTETQANSQGLSVQQRVKWCFKKQRVTFLLAQLEFLKLSLTVMLQVLQLGKLMKTKSGSGSPVDDEIAQERADTQNMVIVRYWSLRRLDRLWYLAEEEAREAENDEMNLLIGQSQSPRSSAQSFQQPDADSNSTVPVRVPVVALGELDASLGATHESPRDMLQSSERVIDSLLMTWTRIHGLYGSASESLKEQSKGFPQTSVSSESDDESLSNEFDNNSIQGYYLEGTTVDWRKPHSQEARKRAARLRQKYTKYQPRIDSDSEDSEESDPSDKHEPDGKRRGNDGTGLEKKTQPKDINVQARPYPSDTGSFATDRGQSVSGSSYNESRPMRRPQLQPRPISTPHHHYSYSPQSTSVPRRMAPSPVSPIPQHSPYMGFSPPTQPRYYPPTRSSRRSPSHDSHGRNVRINSPYDSGREDTRDRHKSLRRSATKGILGMSAIAGFMDALEAFSIL